MDYEVYERAKDVRERMRYYHAIFSNMEYTLKKDQITSIKITSEVSRHPSAIGSDFTIDLEQIFIHKIYPKLAKIIIDEARENYEKLKNKFEKI